LTLKMKNTTWHIHVHRPIAVRGDSDVLTTLNPGEYTLREADLVSYEIAERATPMGRLRLAELLKLRGSGAITIDGAFP
jgi:hypothetical protein